MTVGVAKDQRITPVGQGETPRSHGHDIGPLAPQDVVGRHVEGDAHHLAGTHPRIRGKVPKALSVAKGPVGKVDGPVIAIDQMDVLPIGNTARVDNGDKDQWWLVILGQVDREGSQQQQCNEKGSRASHEGPMERYV